MRSSSASSLRALFATLLITLGASAQSKVGIYVSRGISTISGITCGFDCSSPTNTVRANTNVNDILDVRVLGETGFPGYVFLASGSSFPCPGIPIAGITNALLLKPSTLVPILFSLPSLPMPARGTGGETGNGIVLGNLLIPPGTSGGMVTFQGLAYDAGVLHFTRPIELRVN